MRAVDILRRRPEDAATERLARLTVGAPGDAAVLEVLIPEFREGMEQIIADGAPDEQGRWVHLEDGEAFLDAALGYFRGSRFWAREVDPDDPA